MSKFTSAERSLVKSIVASQHNKEDTCPNVINEIYKQTNKTLSRTGLYYIRQQIKKESYHWYKTMREGQYEYIHEMVNEILENAVWPFQSFSPFILAPGLETDLNDPDHVVSDALKNSFDPPLDKNAASITIGGEGEAGTPDEPSWYIDDLPFTYTIQKQKNDNQIHVISRSHQTKGSALERAAISQYINTAAYDKVLKKCVHPWSLPFHFWLEESRTYLGQIGVMRHEIMETFRTGDRRTILNDVVVSREYLRISTEEAYTLHASQLVQDVVRQSL